jgi:branched-chain amino acid aminotransferase
VTGAKAAGSGAAESTHTPGGPAIWLNGVPQPAHGPHVSARDRGFALADGVFETMRVRHGRVFRLDAHLTRLRGGLRALQIPVPEALRSWVLDAARAAAAADGSVRLTVTRGVGQGGVSAKVESGPTTTVVVSPMPAFPGAIYDAGLIAHVVSGRRNERSMTAGIKTLAYTDAIAGLLEAQRTGADEALFLDTEAHCSEASASNLFVWTGQALITPPLSCGALPGITRAAVLELAHGLGLTVSDDPFDREQLCSGAEAFLTSSLRGIAPLVRVDGRSLGEGRPGPVTRRLADAYAALVERECSR